MIASCFHDCWVSHHGGSDERGRHKREDERPRSTMAEEAAAVAFRVCACLKEQADDG